MNRHIRRLLSEPPFIVRYRSATTHAAESIDADGFVTLCGLTITDHWTDEMPHVRIECLRCQRAATRRWPERL